jgi:hypothetical protein
MWKDHIFQKALGPVLQQTLHDLLFNFSLNCLSLLQQQNGPGPEYDDLSFSYLQAAPVVLL